MKETFLITNKVILLNSLQSNLNLIIFNSSIKKEKKKDKYYLPNIVPTLSTTVPEIKYKSSESNKFNYKYFPKLDSSLYVKSDIPKQQYVSKFETSKDEVNYIINIFKVVL